MKHRLLGLVAAAALLAGCDDPLNPTPQQQIPQQEALDDPEEIQVATNAMYDAFQDCDGGYCRNLVIFPDLYADNLRFTGTYTTDREVASRLVRSDNTAVEEIWGVAYDAINRANNLIAAIPTVEELDEDEAAVYTGEAHFVRGSAYFDLVKYFGGVPLVTAPEWSITPDVNVPRSTDAQIWALVESDLNAAIGGLPSANSGDQPPGRATREAAQALLARAHLYQREWQQAYNLANAVIGSGAFELEEDYASAFDYESEGSPEHILSIPFTTTDSNGLAFWFFTSALGGRWGIAPTTSDTTATNRTRPLVGTFEEDDERLDVAVGLSGTRFYGRKYNDIAGGTDDVPVIRLAEVYLIRAEAAARLGLLTEAVNDVNVIRERAGVSALDPLDASLDTQQEVLLAVLDERRRELFYEGHRFFDLRRFIDIPSVNAYLDELGLTGPQLLFPIPQREIDANSELTQNPGY